MPVPQLERSTLVGQVISTLEDLITAGEWPVGAKLPAEPDLMRSLGVSRNTLREAVRALSHAGLLVPRPGDGTYVRTTSGLDAALERMARRAKAADVLAVRDMLERGAARAAARERSDADLARIDAALQRWNNSSRSGNLDAFADDDLEFHRAVVAAAHNPVLTELYATLTDAVRGSVLEVLRGSLGADSHQARAHARLARAIARQDPTAADRAVSEHLAAAAATLDQPGR